MGGYAGVDRQRSTLRRSRTEVRRVAARDRLATAGAAKEDREPVADELAATVGKERRQTDQARTVPHQVRVTEVFVEWTEKTGLSIFGFSGQGHNPALRGHRRLPEERMQPAGPKNGGLVYTE